jgi:hypothetical protein
LLTRRRVLITRCAWHRGYYGYTIVVGVASWRGWTVGLSDGICRRCARQVRAAWLDERRRAVGQGGAQRPASGARPASKRRRTAA